MYNNITRQQVSSVQEFLIETFKNDSIANNLSCFRIKKWNWINWLPYWCNFRNMEVFMYELRKYRNTSNVVKMVPMNLDFYDILYDCRCPTTTFIWGCHETAASRGETSHTEVGFGGRDFTRFSFLVQTCNEGST